MRERREPVERSANNCGRTLPRCTGDNGSQRLRAVPGAECQVPVCRVPGAKRRVPSGECQVPVCQGLGVSQRSSDRSARSLRPCGLLLENFACFRPAQPGVSRCAVHCPEVIMNRRVILLVSTVIIAAASNLSAQFSTPAPPPTPTPQDTMSTVGMDFLRNTYYAVGLNVGLLSGAGLSGRAVFPGGIGAQLTFFAVSVPGQTYGTHFNIGGELQYAFS